MSDLEILDYSRYGNAIDAESDRLLADAATELGLATVIRAIGPETLPEISAPRIWLRFDLRRPTDLEWIVQAARTLRDLGHAVFPSPEAIRNAEDKWETFRILRASGLPTPDTWPATERRHCPLPAMLKPRVGWGGKLNRRLQLDAEREAASAGASADMICQPFIAHRRTWVVAVAAGETLTVLQERREWESPVDFSREGDARPATLPASATGLAQAALEATGLVAGTVDLIESATGFQVLEVNAAPKIAYPENPSVNLARPMVRAVMHTLDTQCA